MGDKGALRGSRGSIGVKKGHEVSKGQGGLTTAKVLLILLFQGICALKYNSFRVLACFF